MDPDWRQSRIEHYLQKVEFASLEELAREVGVSVSTVRRDVCLLEAAGTLKRTHGGARLLNPRNEEFIFSARDTRQASEKESIAQACAGLIEPNETVILDAGTTVFHVARYLEPKTPHIITNSLPVANLFAASHSMEVVLSGGVIYPRLGVLVGPIAVEAFAKMRADVAIMGAGGISLEGITNSHGLLIDIQRAMIQGVQRVIFCLDHTKFGRHSVLPLCGLDLIDTVVTDAEPPAELLEALRQNEVNLIVAQPQQAPAH